MTALAKCEINEFHVAIVALHIIDWQEANVTFRVRHIPSSIAGKFLKSISKDDYLLRRAEISGSRTDFVERDLETVAMTIIELVRPKVRRGEAYGKIVICVEEIEICEWDNSL